MIKNEKLELICSKLVYKEPEWNSLIDRFYKKRKLLPEGPLAIEDYCRFFSEEHLDLSLREEVGRIKKDHPEYSISFDPLKDTEKRQEEIGWRFRYDCLGRIQGYSKRIGQPSRSIEYDNVLLVDQIPLVFEIKIGGWGRPAQRNCIRDELRLERNKRKLRPLMHLFNSDAGFALVIPDQIFEYRESSLTEEQILWNDFKKRDGIIIPFYTDKKSFRWDVTQIVIKHDLNRQYSPRISSVPITLV